jgi:CRISPR-associated protein Csb1
MELALQEAIDDGRIKMPLLIVDCSAHAPTGDVEADAAAGRLIDDVGKITSLQVPHRIADAILRDGELRESGAKVSFRKSSKGKLLNKASFANATTLFKLCPTALIFGMWDSTGPKGGLGPAFERDRVRDSRY